MRADGLVARAGSDRGGVMNDIPGITRACGTVLPLTFTADQVAANLHKSVRWLRRFASLLPGMEAPGAGRVMLFSARDVKRIKAALRPRSSLAGDLSLRTARRDLLRKMRRQRKAQRTVVGSNARRV